MNSFLLGLFHYIGQKNTNQRLVGWGREIGWHKGCFSSSYNILFFEEKKPLTLVQQKCLLQYAIVSEFYVVEMFHINFFHSRKRVILDFDRVELENIFNLLKLEKEE